FKKSIDLLKTDIKDEHPIALNILELTAYLGPNDVELDLLYRIVTYIYGNKPDIVLLFNKHLLLNKKYSLIKIKDNKLSINKFLRLLIIRDSFGKGPFFEYKSKINNILIKVFPNFENEFKFILSNSNFLELYEKNIINQKTYNSHSAELDLIVASIYFYKGDYEKYFKVIDRAYTFLEKTNHNLLLKCKAQYLYSAYFRKMKQFDKALEKIKEADNILLKLQDLTQTETRVLKKTL